MLLSCRPDDKVVKTEKAVNGEEKPDSGLEPQTTEGPAEEEGDPLGPNCYYDKTKSFFDNISCDDTRYTPHQTCTLIIEIFIF